MSFVLIDVSIAPGAILFTVIPCGANSISNVYHYGQVLEFLRTSSGKVDTSGYGMCNCELRLLLMSLWCSYWFFLLYYASRLLSIISHAKMAVGSH